MIFSKKNGIIDKIEKAHGKTIFKNVGELQSIEESIR